MHFLIYDFYQGLVFCMIITRIGMSVAWKSQCDVSVLSTLLPTRQSPAIFRERESNKGTIIQLTTSVEQRVSEPAEYNKAGTHWPITSSKIIRVTIRFQRE